MDPIAVLNNELRRRLRIKQSELAENFADMLEPHNDRKSSRAIAAAIRRNEKSLALLTSKLLCSHAKIETSTMHTPQGKHVMSIYCPTCRART